ncbi:hypothetical protein IB223_06595 [Pseudoxanthomonas sp. PXM03]|uniref:hypothetical protein n=1 Tax=Pseudoxanthomonas sp. PXM03 TaxID=2769284 RepID=UPI00177E5DF6|nr:hypothetical protein [Pseudoxanthomonas sp. PXM03]MBD9435753.1 hypothetical protein [Pseudoxanthomonas sp. PXM03]
MLKIGAWFEELRRRTGAPSAYALGKLVRPETYTLRIDKNPPQHHNLWAKYAAGLHAPGLATLKQTSALVPGSEQILLAAFWDAFDVSQPLQQRGDILLRGLRPGVVQAIYEPGPLAAGRYVRRRAPKMPLMRLEGQADLQSLAAAVVLLREAFEAQDRERAFAVGHSVHSLLLMACAEMGEVSIAEELLGFFVMKIFPLAATEEVQLAPNFGELILQMKMLRVIHSSLKQLGTLSDKPASTKQLRKVLVNGYGFDFGFALAPKLRLVNQPEQTSEAARRRVGFRRASQKWALGVLFSGRREKIPSDHALDLMAADEGLA